jgi:hypothetical protein
MSRGNIHRSGFISMGENTPPGDVDDPENQVTDQHAPIPEANQPGHDHGDEDPDKPVSKFREKFPAPDDRDDKEG